MDTALRPNQVEDDDAGRNGQVLCDLVAGARRGDACAWRQLIIRFTPLVVSVTRGFRLSAEDADDVSQVVWLKLFENIRRLREPRALPGWIRTTAKHEALRQLRAGARTQVMDPALLASFECAAEMPEVDDDLLRVERERVINEGLDELDPHHRSLLIALHTDDRPSYRAISQSFGMPVGSIGPTRARSLQKLRTTPSVSAFLHSDRDAELLAAG
ncbi:MAG: sigma-70 family RNA polymerase sigma factor [Nakamurella sp.]